MMDFVLMRLITRATLQKALRDSLLNRESAQYGMALGSFSFLWKFVNNTFRLRFGENPRRNGSVAGLFTVSLFFMFTRSRSYCGFVLDLSTSKHSNCVHNANDAESCTITVQLPQVKRPSACTTWRFVAV